MSEPTWRHEPMQRHGLTVFTLFCLPDAIFLRLRPWSAGSGTGYQSIGMWKVFLAEPTGTIYGLGAA